MKFCSKMFKITKIYKKTKAKLFKDLIVGDCIYCTMDLKNTTGASSGIYATDIIIHIRNAALKIANSQNQFLNNIKNFELEEMQ